MIYEFPENVNLDVSVQQSKVASLTRVWLHKPPKYSVYSKI